MGWIEDGVGSCNVLGGAGCGGRGKFDVLVIVNNAIAASCVLLPEWPPAAVVLG